jgi:hypothetical protein
VMKQAQTWIHAFGPIQVKVIQTTGLEKPLDEQLGGIGGQGTDKQVFAAARIEVRALTSITPEMIPALLSGHLSGGYPNGKQSGLINLIASSQSSPQLAYRLGGGRHVPYRATTEPFLAFVLTRSIPNAVFSRIERGLRA